MNIFYCGETEESNESTTAYKCKTNVFNMQKSKQIDTQTEKPREMKICLPTRRVKEFLPHFESLMKAFFSFADNFGQDSESTFQGPFVFLSRFLKHF